MNKLLLTGLLMISASATAGDDSYSRAQDVFITSQVAAAYAVKINSYVEGAYMSLVEDECVRLNGAAKRFIDASNLISFEEMQTVLSKDAFNTVASNMDLILYGQKMCDAVQ